MNRNSNRSRYNDTTRLNTPSLGNNRTYQGRYERDTYENQSTNYDDGYDDNYPSPSYSMNAGNMNAGKRNRFEDNIFRPDRHDRYEMEDELNDDMYDEYDRDDNDYDTNPIYGHEHGRYDHSYFDTRNHENRNVHYGKEDDDRYSKASVYAGRNKRGTYTNETQNRRGKTQYDTGNEKMNSREYDNMYDNITHNTGDYRYHNIGGGTNSRYNTFNDDRDYYRGYTEFAGDKRNQDRWRGRLIHG